MTWQDTMKAIGGADIAFLSEDGEVLQFLICADPVLYQGKYKGNATKRIMAVIAIPDGITVAVLGMRAARRLTKYEDQFGTHVMEVIRHGAKGDVESSYDVRPIDDPELFAQLSAIKDREFSPEIVPELIKGAVEILSS